MVGPSVARRCGIIAGVGALGVMMVSCRKETDCDVYSSLSDSIGILGMVVRSMGKHACKVCGRNHDSNHTQFCVQVG